MIQDALVLSDLAQTCTNPDLSCKMVLETKVRVNLKDHTLCEAVNVHKLRLNSQPPYLVGISNSFIRAILL